MMTPRSSSSGSFVAMCAAASREMLNVATVLRSSTWRKVSRSCGPSLPSVRLATPPPAVVTLMCRPPSSATAVARTASVPVKSVTSTTWKRPPMSAATCSPSEPARSSTVTCAPRAASSSAVARPMPDAPPKTTAFFPWISTVPLRLSGERSDRGGRRGHGVDQPVTVDGAVALEHLVGLGPAQEEVQVVLPGEADATVQLQRRSGDLAGHGGGVRRGHAGRGRRVVGTGVGGHRRRVRGRTHAHHLLGHARAGLLDRLEATDRAAELDADADVVEGQLEHPIE